MGSEASGLDKPRYEKEWASQEARLKLDATGRHLWDSSRHTVRPYLYYNKIFIAWGIDANGEVVVRDVFTVISMDATFRDGFWIKLRDRNRREHLITHTPRLLGDTDIFAWVPYFNECRWHSNDWSDPAAPKSLRLAVCFKMQSDPQCLPLLREQDYLSELHHFRQQFPQFAKTRF